jgi:vacuolar-type H+-ATPase subunit F/Vma7
MKKKKNKKSSKETDYLLSIPGMKKSLIKEMKEPVKKAINKINW